MKQANELTINSTLYSHHTEYSKMIEQVHNYVKITNLPIRCIMFTSKSDVYKYFAGGSFGEFKINKEYLNNGIYIGELFRKYGRKEEKRIKGRFLLFKHYKYDIYLILTHEETAFFEHGLLRYVRDKYPVFTLPFFYSWEMEIMLNNLSKSNPLNSINLTKFSWKSRIKSESSRKKKESDLTWTDVPYKEVFKQTGQNDAWIEKVHFDLISEIKKDDATVRRTVLSGSISRDGIFKLGMDFKLFYEAIIEKSVEIFFKRKEKLSGRARIRETNYESKPFFIEFDEPIFKNKEQNFRLIGILRNLPHLAYSVVHANPYLHMTATDYIDNSNYDIWILSDNKITIAPQTVCSMSALNRLCDHISREFKEGLVKDFNESV